MKIYGENDTALYDVEPDDDSYRIREVKGEHALYLNMTLPTPVNLPLGCYIDYEGIRYSLEEPPTILKHDTRNIKYQCVFSSPQALLSRYRFRNTVDGRLKFQLTAKPHEHLQMLVDNLNLRDSDKGWTAGECIDDVEKVIDYDYTGCMEVLDMIAEAFDTEWEISNKVISLKKVEYGKDNPLPLSYGKGNGFVSGVGRNNRSDEDSGLEIVYAIGGDRNIVPDKNTGGQKKQVQGNRPVTSIAPIAVEPHRELVAPMPMAAMAASAPAQMASAVVVNPGLTDRTDTDLSSERLPVTTTNKDGVSAGNKCLILPRSQQLIYEGEVYATDDQGYYVYKKNKPLTTRKEGALDCSDIYPSRVGTISEVIAVDAEKNFYDFVDSSIPDDLDYEECIMDGEKMTVIFQDGMLAGKEFDVNYKHATRRFEIVPQEVDNVTMPNDIFKPVVGGKYAVFNVNLPDAYVCDNATQTGASWDMFRKAAEYLHDHADYLFTFNGTMDGIWAKRNWEAIKDRLVPGGTILFSDNQFQPDGVMIRITSIKDFLNDPYRPEIELSNEVVGQKLIGRIAQLENREVSEEVSAASNRQFTKRTFRDAKNTMQALQEALDSFKGEFTDSVRPVTVSTMQMLVGSERCQFEFVNRLTAPINVITHEARYDDAKKEFSCAAGYVRYSYGSTMSGNGNGATKMASVAKRTFGNLESDKAYYVYVKVNPNVEPANNTTNATFEMSVEAKDYEADGFIYLLLGILNKEQELNRSWCPMYGYTEITPGRIRVDKIISSDGKTYFDLLNNVIGGKINFVDGIISENVDMTNAIIRGKIISNVIELTQNNFNDYTMDLELETSIMKVMDFNKLLGVKTTLVIKYQPEQFAVFTPFIRWWNSQESIKSRMNKFCNLDDFIGNRIRIINESNYDFGISDVVNGEEYVSLSIKKNTEMCIECVLDVIGGKKSINWEVKYMGDIVNYN